MLKRFVFFIFLLLVTSAVGQMDSSELMYPAVGYVIKALYISFTLYIGWPIFLLVVKADEELKKGDPCCDETTS